MSIPFPGMDPFLERPALWPGVHNSLIAALGCALGPRLRPRYFVRVEQRAYLAESGDILVGVPDVSVHARGAVRPMEPGGGETAPE